MSAALLLLIGVLGAGQPASPDSTPRIAGIRVHGNHTTPDADILDLSGLAAGDEASDGRLDAAGRALRQTGRFESVEVRRRYLSITDRTQVLVVIVVDEHPAVREHDLTPGPVKKVLRRGMWLPILRHEDGYGLTYGARYGLSDVLGDRSRLSVPLTWGGERRVALEADRVFDGPITVLRGGVSLHRRINAHFDVADTRREARIEVERAISDWLRAGASGRVAAVGFGREYDARHTAGGVHAVVDTRIDPSFPRNAVHARVDWERLAFEAGRAGRWRADARGYVGIVGSTVLALRVLLETSDAALPEAEQVLLGGSGTVRGYRTGYRAGDNLAATTIEVRRPLDSPLSIGRFGVKAFVDAGTAWTAGTRLGDQRFDRGIGGGVYFGAGPFVINLDLAWPEDGGPRTHLGLGVSF